VGETFVDFRTIKQLVSITSVLDRYRITLRKVNQQSLRGKCPLPTHTSEKSAASFGVQTVKNIWSCQSTSCASTRQGKKGGNVIDFVAIMERCSIRDAAVKLHEWFLSATASPQLITATPATVERGTETSTTGKLVAERSSDGDAVGDVNKPLSFILHDIDSSHSYLRQRGIKEETAGDFGVGFFPGRGSMSGRVVIPIHNERGELVAYAGRSIDGSEPKYKLPKGFVKSAVLYNFHRVVGEEVIVVEGFFDCLKIWQAGSLNVVALMGSSLPARQQELLSRFKRIILFLDGDEAGRGAASEIAGRLVHSHFVRVVDLEAGKQPDQLSSQAIRGLLQF